MCTGVEIALLASAAVGAAGSVAAGQSQKKMGEYNAQIAQNEAVAAQQKAAFDEDRQRQQSKMFAARQRASISAAGGEQGDAGDVLSMTAEEAEIDALAIRYGGNAAAQSAMQRGNLAKAQAKQAATASYAKAGQTLLTAGANAYGSMGPSTKPNYNRVSSGGGRRDASGFIG